MESDFWYDIKISKWRPWRHLMQKSDATWWTHEQCMPGTYATASPSSWSIVYAYMYLFYNTGFSYSKLSPLVDVMTDAYMYIRPTKKIVNQTLNRCLLNAVSSTDTAYISKMTWTWHIPDKYAKFSAETATETLQSLDKSALSQGSHSRTAYFLPCYMKTLVTVYCLRVLQYNYIKCQTMPPINADTQKCKRQPEFFIIKDHQQLITKLFTKECYCWWL